jgi:hypothetical protein
MYYKLVRHLIENCWKNLCRNNIGDISAEAERLERVKTAWLETPDEEFGDRSPAYILECERKRLPLIASEEEVVVEDDCPICQMMRDIPIPTFCHFDGSDMEDAFAFSFCLSQDEWEAENNRKHDFDSEFEKHWQHQNAGNGAE